MNNIDVSGLSNGTITFTAVATDAAGNTAQDSMTATASGLAIALAQPAGQSVPAPSISQNGDTVTVGGTTGNDDFQFIAGTTTNTLIVNGVSYQFDFNASNFIFVGGGGLDSASLTGLGGDTAHLGLGGGTFSGPNFNVERQRRHHADGQRRRAHRASPPCKIQP